MCVYNAAEFLQQSIESILEQTFTDFELLIWDDGSSDNSFEIISSYQDPRIRVFRNSRNRGIAYSCNNLIRESKGEYLSRHDSDDISLPGRFQKQMDFFEKHPKTKVCGTNVTVFGDKRLKKFYPLRDEEIRAYMILNDPFCTSTVIFKKPEIPVYFNESLVVSEDYSFFFELSKFTKMANLAEHLLNYRWHPKNITRLRKQLMVDSTNQIRSEILNHSLDYQIEEPETSVLNLAFENKLKSTADLNILEAFILKLIKRNQEVKYYHQTTLQNLFFHHWFTNCFKLKEINVPGKIKIFFTSELFKISSLLHFISRRNFRSFTNILFNK